MALRLRGESTSDAADEVRDGASLPEPSNLITGEDILSDDAGEDDDGDENESLWPSVPGPLIAGLTFVPTFLAVLFGLSYLLSNVHETPPTASTRAPATAKVDVGRQMTPPPPESLRDPLGMPRTFEPPTTGSPIPGWPIPGSPIPGAPIAGIPRDSAPNDGAPAEGIRPSEPRDAPRTSSGENATRPAFERETPPAAPTLPPLARSPVPEPRPARSAESSRQPRAAVLTITPERTPTAESGKSREWTPAAAFADREAAGRLANSIQQQGYPVEIRQDQSSSRPWVVWIGAKPSGGERRR
jgi:hypothetical protein